MTLDVTRKNRRLDRCITYLKTSIASAVEMNLTKIGTIKNEMQRVCDSLFTSCFENNNDRLIKRG